MLRSSKPKPTENHTPNHHPNQNGEAADKDGEGSEGAGTPVTDMQDTPPQLSIEDTVFVSSVASPTQRSSVVSDTTSRDVKGEGQAGDRCSVASVEGSSGLVVVSVCVCV